MSLSPNFWKTKKLNEMTRAEWEALCDGCARCCLYKLQDEDSEEILYTNVVCHLLDLSTCHCTHYAERSQLMPTCVTLTPENVQELNWMPETCAYRLLANGADLPSWHPLVSGRPDSVSEAEITIGDKVLTDEEVDMELLEDYVVDWL